MCTTDTAVTLLDFILLRKGWSCNDFSLHNYHSKRSNCSKLMNVWPTITATTRKSMGWPPPGDLNIVIKWCAWILQLCYMLYVRSKHTDSIALKFPIQAPVYLHTKVAFMRRKVTDIWNPWWPRSWPELAETWEEVALGLQVLLWNWSSDNYFLRQFWHSYLIESDII